ncbi:MAG: hypothetical protein ABJO09_16050 [Hyphomicrobiales bacterium]
MLQTEISDQLLSLVYATVTDQTKWQSFCDELNFISEVPVMMFGHNLKKNTSLGLLGGGLDPEELQVYHEHFADKNPWMHMNAVMPTGMVGVSDQAMTRRDLFKTEFYNDWLRKQEDIVAGPFMMCHRTQNTFVGLAAACLQKNVEATLPRAQELLNAVAPHLRRVISISSLLNNGAAASENIIQASKHAIFLLTKRGKVSCMNRAGEAFLSRFQLMSVTQSKYPIAQNEKISGFLARLLAGIETGSASVLSDPIFVRVSEQDNFAFHAHMFPEMSRCDFPAANWNDPVVAALIVAGGNANDEFRKIAASFGATPAEQKLAEGVAHGQRLNDYADSFGLSRHTVRNQMRALLQKSNCKSQIDFTRLMLSLTSPFLSE